MEPWIIWLIAAVLLLIIEVLSTMVWTLCLAIGCLAAMVASLLGADVAWQLVTMAVAAIQSFIFIAPRFRRWLHKSHADGNREDRTGMDALLGRKATVTHEIRRGELGRVRIDGDSWQARAPGADRDIERGEQVSVTGYDSIILTVK